MPIGSPSSIRRAPSTSRLNVKMVIMAVFGGPGTVLGPVLGAFMLSAVYEVLASSNFHRGGLFFGVVIVARGGLHAARPDRSRCAGSARPAGAISSPNIRAVTGYERAALRGARPDEALSRPGRGQRRELHLEHGRNPRLIGPNGAGKTTLVSLISGTLRLDAGEIFSTARGSTACRLPRGPISASAAPSRSCRPFPGLTVLDNVAVGALFGARRRRAATARKARGSAARMARLRRPGETRGAARRRLGGPDRKRLEFAKALAMQPKLLLLDEVMAGLNSSRSTKSIDVIKQDAREGVSILVIEHVIKAIKKPVRPAARVESWRKDRRWPAGGGAVVPRVVEAYLGRASMMPPDAVRAGTAAGGQ